MPTQDFSVSIIVPAYNEEDNIAQALQNVHKAIQGLTDDYEILVFSDGSQDRTGRIVQDQARLHPGIKLIEFEENQGYGYVFKEGIRLASKKYFLIFHGDNDMAWQSTRDLILNAGQSDLISSYLTDMKIRSLFRRIISQTFVMAMNCLFGMQLRYFNGPFICRCELLSSLPLRSPGLTVVAETKIRLIKKGHSYKEIPFQHIGRRGGKSTALRFKNVVTVISVVAVLWKEIYLTKDSEKK